MKSKKITSKDIKGFEAFLYNREKSENTIKKYLRDVRFFIKYTGSKCISKADVLEYKRIICENYSPKSVNSMLSSLNAFFEFLNRYDLKVKSLKIQRQIFSDKAKELAKCEYERLLTAARSKKNERLYLLMQTLASTGLRVSEIKYITAEAVRSGIATIKCKGKIRQVFLPKNLCKMLKAYIKTQNIKSGPVFVTSTGKPLDRSNIWKMMKSLCSSAGVSKEKVFPHNFRHLFARTYYSIQKDIVRLADILGHSSINTTRIYTTESGDVHIKQIQRLGLLRC